jgi:hypothetical protein
MLYLSVTVQLWYLCSMFGICETFIVKWHFESSDKKLICSTLHINNKVEHSVQPLSDGQCTKDTLLLFIHSLKTSEIKTERLKQLPSSANTVKDKLQDLAKYISRHLTEESDILVLHVPEQDN